MTQIMFEVPGVPVGKGRPKFARRGNFVTAYTPEKTASYENLVKLYASQAMNGSEPISGPVDVQMALHIPVPQSWSQKKRDGALKRVIYPTSKPDLDNVIKGIFDACNGITWNDDKQAIGVTAVKMYSASPKVVVRINTID